MMVNTHAMHRLPELDLTRGLAIVGMILVVSPGSWSYRLSWLTHAHWHGYTAADLVFPLFLFSVGIALSISFRRAVPTRLRLIRGAKRIGLLIGLGLLLNLLPSFDFTHWRLPGILQRIALCYGLAMVAMLVLSKATGRGRSVSYVAIGGCILCILALWQVVLSTTSAPGFPIGDLSQGGTWSSWLDRSIFTVNHLWPYGQDESGQVVYDPEGLLVTFPAATSVLMGFLTHQYLENAPGFRRLMIVIAAGIFMVVSGHFCDNWAPINKPLWTASFAMVASGWSMIIFAAFSTLVKSGMQESTLLPLWILGRNAILAFSLSQCLSAYAGTTLAGFTPQSSTFELVFRVMPYPYMASLICALLVVTFITAVLYPLSRKGLFIRL